MTLIINDNLNLFIDDMVENYNNTNKCILKCFIRNPEIDYFDLVNKLSNLEIKNITIKNNSNEILLNSNFYNNLSFINKVYDNKKNFFEISIIFNNIESDKNHDK